MPVPASGNTLNLAFNKNQSLGEFDVSAFVCTSSRESPTSALERPQTTHSSGASVQVPRYQVPPLAPAVVPIESTVVTPPEVPAIVRESCPKVPIVVPSVSLSCPKVPRVGPSVAPSPTPVVVPPPAPFRVPAPTAAPRAVPSEPPTFELAPAVVPIEATVVTPPEVPVVVRPSCPKVPMVVPSVPPSCPKVPIVVPSVAPIPTPMVVPPPAPSRVKAPTAAPRAVPSEPPTFELAPPTPPRMVPSQAPAPARAPSPAPSVVPSKAPAPKVGFRPVPSVATGMPPKVVPSQAPVPTVAPSLVPSVAPSNVPKVLRTPGSIPSSGPSVQPSRVPTDTVLPAVAPSSAHKLMPPNVPTGAPVPGVNPARPSNRAPTMTPTSPSPSPTEARDPPHERDALDDLVRDAVETLKQSSSWEDFVARGQAPNGDLHPDVGKLPHRAAHLLNRLRVSGAPVETKSAPWTRQQKQEAIRRGPHQSAHQHVDFLRQEYVDMICKGQWVLLPARLILGEKNLKLSPLGVVPQRDRRPRTISDYYFFGVNDDTIPLSPGEAMQFGCALQRILRTIARADPRLGPVYLSKIDIADGFYRIGVRVQDIPKLGVLFPERDGEE
jgi:hypothetical protein